MACEAANSVIMFTYKAFTVTAAAYGTSALIIASGVVTLAVAVGLYVVKKKYGNRANQARGVMMVPGVQQIIIFRRVMVVRIVRIVRIVRFRLQ